MPINSLDNADLHPTVRIIALKSGTSYTPADLQVVRELDFERNMKLVFDASTGQISTSPGFPFSIVFSQPNGYRIIRLEIESGVWPPIPVQTC